MLGRWIRPALAAIALLIGPGCTLAPRRFEDRDNLAPLVRARALTLNDGLPPQVVIPALIERLEDPDPVVRLTAHGELIRHTGRDFGYRPWLEAPERAVAAARWRAWWSNKTPVDPASRPAPAPIATAARPAAMPPR